MANNINQIVDSLISINQVIENFRLQREKMSCMILIVLTRFNFYERMKWGCLRFLHFY